MDALWSVCFGQGQVSVEELYDDFVAQESACAFAYLGDEIVGCIAAYRRDVRYKGREIVLGGYGGVCTREDMRGRGIGLALCRAAHRLLEQEGCDIAFLSADRELLKLYAKLGFVQDIVRRRQAQRPRKCLAVSCQKAAMRTKRSTNPRRRQASR